ncbi:hypothetical protein ACCO45_002144 [Purpureocillium lilacinum]|uniref:Uncharacterized protein n=1 Tax=Purpureocillium lilacinum TaxID=33203 RepID=A0ACC4E911_PURLI
MLDGQKGLIKFELGGQNTKDHLLLWQSHESRADDWVTGGDVCESPPADPLPRRRGHEGNDCRLELAN